MDFFLGVFAADAFWLRKAPLASWLNAGREVIALVAAFGAYAAVLRLTDPPGVTLEFLPAGLALVGIYFFAARSLFYFTLLLRGKRPAAARSQSTERRKRAVGRIISGTARRRLSPANPRPRSRAGM